MSNISCIDTFQQYQEQYANSDYFSAQAKTRAQFMCQSLCELMLSVREIALSSFYTLACCTTLFLHRSLKQHTVLHLKQIPEHLWHFALHFFAALAPSAARNTYHILSLLSSNINFEDRVSTINELSDGAIQEYFFKQAMEEKFNITPQAADGNCLFSSITALIPYSSSRENSTESPCQRLRRHVVNHIYHHREIYEERVHAVCATHRCGSLPFEQYCREMLRPRMWGQELELDAASTLLQRPIEIYARHMCCLTEEGEFIPYQTIGNEYEAAPLRLYFNGDNHYDSLITLP